MPAEQTNESLKLAFQEDSYLRSDVWQEVVKCETEHQLDQLLSRLTSKSPSLGLSNASCSDQSPSPATPLISAKAALSGKALDSLPTLYIPSNVVALLSYDQAKSIAVASRKVAKSFHRIVGSKAVYKNPHSGLSRRTPVIYIEESGLIRPHYKDLDHREVLLGRAANLPAENVTLMLCERLPAFVSMPRRFLTNKRMFDEFGVVLRPVHEHAGCNRPHLAAHSSCHASNENQDVNAIAQLKVDKNERAACCSEEKENVPPMHTSPAALNTQEPIDQSLQAALKVRQKVDEQEAALRDAQRLAEMELKKFRELFCTEICANIDEYAKKEKKWRGIKEQMMELEAPWELLVGVDSSIQSVQNKKRKYEDMLMKLS